MENYLTGTMKAVSEVTPEKGAKNREPVDYSPGVAVRGSAG